MVHEEIIFLTIYFYVINLILIDFIA